MPCYFCLRWRDDAAGCHLRRDADTALRHATLRQPCRYADAVYAGVVDTDATMPYAPMLLQEARAAVTASGALRSSRERARVR